MSVLRNFEDKIAGLVEGTFGRVFRTQVRPVEIARKLTREMDEHKTISVSRTYVPNEYVVWLCPEDHERFDGVEREVIDELSAYLLEHARREKLALVSRPKIEFRTDERLHLGEFGIQARLVREAAQRGPSRPTTATRWSTRPRPARRRSSTRSAAAASAARSSWPRASATRCRPAAPRSGAAASATSSWATPTSRASTPRSARAATAGRSPTSARPTACASTAARPGPTSRSRSRRATALDVGTVDATFEVQ